MQNVLISQNLLIHVNDTTFFNIGTFWYQSSEKGHNQIIQTKIHDYFKSTLLVGFLLSVKIPASPQRISCYILHADLMGVTGKL